LFEVDTWRHDTQQELSQDALLLVEDVRVVFDSSQSDGCDAFLESLNSFLTSIIHASFDSLSGNTLLKKNMARGGECDVEEIRNGAQIED
jgi:hypothetical protein